MFISSPFPSPPPHPPTRRPKHMFGGALLDTRAHTYMFGESFVCHLHSRVSTSDEFWKYLKNELSTEEAKNAKIADEIEGLSREYFEGAEDAWWFWKI